ncbi:MAG: hypothetical protein K2X27_10280, partial [Candidatus Obscuribacterales bacterium]|nr:hypothetical protein [Candidatus Obscuribacterales bacterium]
MNENLKNQAKEEFIVPEFGRVNLDWFDLSKKYHGAIYRLAPEAAKAIADLLGFAANYEHAGIRAASIDLFETEGFCIFEIERNSKPTEVAARYSRERWTMQETSNKSAADATRPWIKTEFFAKYISEDLIGSVAEQLRINPVAAQKFMIRLNFKDKTFALISEESMQGQLPGGGFAAFVLPTEAMLAVARSRSFSRVDGESPTNLPAFEAASTELLPPSPSRALIVGADSSGALQVAEEKASADPGAGASSAAPPPVASSEQAGEAPDKAEAPLTGSSKALEKFITRKEDITKPETRQNERSEQVESSAKYATYSRSEVDQMLKQQAENIASALGSKISSQQRVFQEAVEKQEKSFARISDNFVNQFDQVRLRLENMSKESEQTIQTEMENFKKELSKELEQHRAQINKTVVPVAKFIEDKNAKPEKS